MRATSGVAPDDPPQDARAAGAVSAHLARFFLRSPRRAAAVLLLAFVALCCDGLRSDTPTVDEFAHLPAGYHYLQTGRFELFPLNPPLVKLLCALPLLLVSPDIDRAARIVNTGWYPWVFGTDFMQRNRSAYDLLFLLGRLPVVALGVLAGALVFRWARELYGDGGGLLALLLFSCCPSLIAHAHLATPDFGAAAAMLAALYCAWRALRAPGGGSLALAALALGAAQLSKFTALLLYPLLVLLALLALARGQRAALSGGAARRVGVGLAALGLVFAGSLLVLDLGYLFEGVGRSVGSTRWQSHALRQAAAWLPPGLPLPLPSAYLDGLDALQRINEEGEFPTYLFGRWSPTSPPSYYLVTLLFKRPLPLLALWRRAPFARRRAAEPAAASELAGAERFLWLPAVALLAVFSLGSKVAYGIRYLLPILPLLCIYAGRIAPALASWRALPRRGVLLLLFVYPLSALLTTPDSLSYFNLCAGGRGDRILLDSNLDWGQGLKRVRHEMDRRGVAEIALAYFGHVDPLIYGIRWHFPSRRPPGEEAVAVSANFAHGYPYATFAEGRMVAIAPGAFAWVERCPRLADLGGGIHLYRTLDCPATRARLRPAAVPGGGPEGPSAGASRATSPDATGSPPR
jgi:hypothetical protein